MTDRDVTAQDAADEGRVVFRLSGPTKLYQGPNATSPVLETLSDGSLATVRDDAGSFLHVVTAAGRPGYIPDIAIVTLVQGSTASGAPGLDEAERSRKRDALIFVSRMEAEAEQIKRALPFQPVASPSLAGIVSGVVGLAGLVAAHAIRGMTNGELTVFFVLDVLLPFLVLTANPKAPLLAYVGALVAYLSLVTGYVAL